MIILIIFVHAKKRTFMETNKSLALSGQNKELTKSFNNINNIDDALALAEKLVSMDSKLVPFKKAGDVVIVLMAARDFKIPITFALANIHPIQGKASAGIHLMSAQILKAGITYKVIEDFSPVYAYVGQGGLTVTQQEILDDRDAYHILGPKATPEQYHDTKTNVIRMGIIDHRTVIKFMRTVPQLDGSYRDMVIYGKFSQKEGMKAGLYESNPNTWVKYERAMVYARAFGDGAKKIGNDVLLGMTEVSMMCDTFNIPYKTDNEGNVVPDLAKAGITKKEADVEDVDVEIVD